MRERALALVLAGSFLVTGGTPAPGEVVDAAAAGFTTRHTIDISAPRAAVYRNAVKHIGDWWSDDHTMSGYASNLYLEAVPQGCFCERLGGGGVVHMTVTFVNPTVMLRLTGGLGPLGLMGVSGNMTWEFDDSEKGTTVTWSYAVGGYRAGGLEELAATVDQVLVEQMNRLKEFSESGEPAG
ncbi:MAG: ATPase [Planctomycetaceae bacterium]